jgi:hypothetical protein
MRGIPFVLALTLGLAAPLAAFAPAPFALAQAQPPGGEEIKQVALTDKQLDSYLSAKKEIEAVLAKMPEDSQGQAPDPKVTAQLEGIAKKHGLASYDEYLAVEDNVGLIMQGMDPQTKKYVGPEAMIKQQIAEVKADKSMSQKDKKEALDQLNAALKSPTKVQFPANIDLVTKNFDKIIAAMPQDQGEEQPKKM